MFSLIIRDTWFTGISELTGNDTHRSVNRPNQWSHVTNTGLQNHHTHTLVLLQHQFISPHSQTLLWALHTPRYYNNPIYHSVYCCTTNHFQDSYMLHQCTKTAPLICLKLWYHCHGKRPTLSEGDRRRYPETCMVPCTILWAHITWSHHITSSICVFCDPVQHCSCDLTCSGSSLLKQKSR